jgi:hypothetical protein
MSHAPGPTPSARKRNLKKASPKKDAGRVSPQVALPRQSCQGITRQCDNGPVVRERFALKGYHLIGVDVHGGSQSACRQEVTLLLTLRCCWGFPVIPSTLPTVGFGGFDFGAVSTRYGRVARPRTKGGGGFEAKGTIATTMSSVKRRHRASLVQTFSPSSHAVLSPAAKNEDRWMKLNVITVGVRQLVVGK